MRVEFWRGISLENDSLQDRDGGRIILKLILAIWMNFFLSFLILLVISALLILVYFSSYFIYLFYCFCRFPGANFSHNTLSSYVLICGGEKKASAHACRASNLVCAVSPFSVAEVLRLFRRLATT